MAKSVESKLDLLFNIEGVQDGREDVSESVVSEYARRHRVDGAIKQADGDVAISLTGISPKVILFMNRGGGTISLKMSGHATESCNVQSNGFLAISAGSVAGISIFTGSVTDVNYEYIVLGN